MVTTLNKAACRHHLYQFEPTNVALCIASQNGCLQDVIMFWYLITSELRCSLRYFCATIACFNFRWSLRQRRCCDVTSKDSWSSPTISSFCRIRVVTFRYLLDNKAIRWITTEVLNIWHRLVRTYTGRLAESRSLLSSTGLSSLDSSSLYSMKSSSWK